ncbi:MAG TPA: hypothetical protein VFV50_09070 [Bdellovibrionales bacterium]|nr:hypothetical protein [Bdellovibrionales bacterium]
MKIVSLTLAASLVLSGCGALQVRDRKEAEVNKIKKVAVVSFSAYLPQSKKLGFDLGSGKLGASEGGSLIAQTSTNVDQMYLSLTQNLRQNLKWDVVPLPKMTSNAGYVKSYKQTMEGWQNKMAPPADTIQFLVKNVMDYDSTRILDQAGRDALLDALGVDALVTARVDVHLNGTSIMGIGSRYPQSKVSFQVHTKGQERPVWFDGGVEGDEAKDSVGETAFIDNAKLEELALQSAKSAFSKIR